MKLDAIFTSHMVFAAKKPIRIYGTGKGEAMLSFAGVEQRVISEGDTWCVELDPMDYGGPYTLTFGDVTLSDVYLGDVYLLAGQSNIEWKLCQSSLSRESYESEPNLRLFSPHRIAKPDPLLPEDGWVSCQKEKAGFFSAIGYFAGLSLVREKKVAVGLISCYKGASAIESWLPKGTLAKAGIFLSDEEKHRDHFHKVYKTWNQEGVLYEFSLSQVIPFSLSGVVWYQGESDTTPAEAAVYGKELELLISLWRRDFRDPNLPFVVVQIADYLKRDDEGWKGVQKAQEEISMPRVTTVVSRDVCENDCIHPPTKNLLALRIADALLQELEK